MPARRAQRAAAQAASLAGARAEVRVGCDVQAVSAVDHAIAHFGPRYLDRVYTPVEQADCRAGGATSLAGRFAAKEAVLKLLGSADGIDLRAVEVVADGGPPQVRLHGEAARLAERADVAAIALSISHDAGLAFAVAVTQPSPASLHHPHETTSGDH